MANQSNIAVVDFGSNYIRMLVVTKDHPAKVLAYEYIESEGISYGVIVDLEKASRTMKVLLMRIQERLDYRLASVYCSIAGDSITPIDSHSVVKIKHRDVSRYDLEELVATAQAITLDNQLVIHTMAKKFKVDNQDGVIDPVGMYGVRLEGDFHLILADKGVCQNITRCLERVGLKCEAFIFMPVGLSSAVLHSDERQQGVVLVDMGKGTTDFSVHHDGHVVFSGSIPLGGYSVTRDIAHKLKVDNDIAEKMKIVIANTPSEQVQFDNNITSDDILNVISARYLQIFKLIERSIMDKGLKNNIGRGFVLCGGASRYKILPEIISDDMGYACRLGGLIQDDMPCLSQSWLSAVGQVYYVQERLKNNHFSGDINPCRGAFKMIQRWMEVYF